MCGTICGTMFGTIPPYFWGIVPIEKGQAFLPVPQVQHLIKRYKYEFLPHAMPTLRKSYLTRQPFLAVTTEFEKRFLCLLHLSLCVVKWVDFQAVLCYTKGRKKQFVHSPAVCARGRKTCGFHCWPHLWPLTASDYPDFMPRRAHESSQSGRKSPEKPVKSRKKSDF